MPLGPALALLRSHVRRRLDREPVSRILGRREFWGLDLAISPAVLDPRADTEGLVGAVIDALGGRRDAPLRLLDLGTGSGAILCALLHEFPSALGIGVDRSPAACRIAADNLQRLGLGGRAAIVCGSWVDSIDGRFDGIVSNPPYIPHADIARLERDVREHDPIAALDGGEDGLDPYRAIVPQLGRLLGPGGVVAFECGWDQGARVAALLETVAVQGVSVYRDLAGHCRVVLGTAA
jgi:release factor glutamine methyltransferase